MVYSLSIFLMLTALLTLSALWLSAADRREQTLGPAQDIEVLNARMGELNWLSVQQMGINASLARNATSSVLSISDAGFPLTNNSLYGRSALDEMGAWLAGNWTGVTNTSLSYSASGVEGNGIVLRTASELNYMQDNADANVDTVSLYLGGHVPQVLNATITCSAPSGAANISYEETAPGGTGTLRYLHFDSIGSYTDSHEADLSEFGSDQNKNFTARYKDSAESWIASLHADWNSSLQVFRIWDEFNGSYAGVDKSKFNCSWVESALYSDDGSAPDQLYIPVDVNLTYGDANYTGNLVLARD